MAGESDKNTTMAWSCCVCSYSLAFIALSITAMVLASCKSEINANLNEKTTAVITEVDRRDKYHCYVTIEFSARGVNESAVTLIACPQKDENSTLGSSIDICYTHNNPSEGPLLTGPKAFIPLERYFIAASPKCANTSYAKALHCKKTLNPVKWTLLGQFLFPIAFVVIASLFMGLVHLFGLCQACIQSFRKKRAVIPDTSLEMAREQA